MRAVEGAAARSSSGIITLSMAAVHILRERHGDEVASKCRVITTCVDLDRFVDSPLPPPTPVRLLLTGTLNELYDVPTMVGLFERMKARRPAELTILTPTATSWEPQLRAAGATISAAPAVDMPHRIAAHHVGLSMRKHNAGLTGHAATPTKLGEFLACGRPVVASPGLGDLDVLLAKYDCGVVIEDRSNEGLDRAVDELERLLDDPGTPDRCREVARAHFDLDRGVDELLSAYRAATS
jgi:glycosyltransferase involved in cell wall biosynthesis